MPYRAMPIKDNSIGAFPKWESAASNHTFNWKQVLAYLNDPILEVRQDKYYLQTTHPYYTQENTSFCLKFMPTTRDAESKLVNVTGNH
jgi:hypothetical protein